MSTKTLIGIFTVAVIGFVFLLVQVSGGSHKISIGPKQAKACTRSAANDDCLPDVKYIDTTGKAWTTESLAGKVVVVNFWATWCHPCQKEIPDLSKIYDQYKAKGVVILGVMADNPDDSQLLNFQSDYAMTYPVVRGNSDLNVAFNYPQNLPTTFVFDKFGHRVGQPKIGSISPAQLTAQLDELVAQN